MTVEECDQCEGHGRAVTDRGFFNCDTCHGWGDRVVAETVHYNDPARSIITHDGRYLCGDCVQLTSPDSAIVLVNSAWNRRTQQWSPVYGEAAL